jgi:carbon monoxide dehydrogenase subunit G
MKLEGEQIVMAHRQHVWDALNDPNVLIRCIPGCEELKKVSDNELHARILAKVGPVRARFSGTVLIGDLVAPSSYTLHFEGSGGAAGIAKGESAVTLYDHGEHTRLHYTVVASVGGKLGQIGGRLIDASAKKMAADFFKTFNDQVGLASETSVAEAVSAIRPDVAATALQTASLQPIAHGPVLAAPGLMTAELHRIMWLAIGLALGAGLAHLWHV